MGEIYKGNDVRGVSIGEGTALPMNGLLPTGVTVSEIRSSFGQAYPMGNADVEAAD